MNRDLRDFLLGLILLVLATVILFHIAGCSPTWQQFRYTGPEATAPRAHAVLFPRQFHYRVNLASGAQPGLLLPLNDQPREGVLFVDNPSWQSLAVVVECSRGRGVQEVCVLPRSTQPINLTVTERDALEEPCRVVTYQEVQQCR